MTENLEKPKRPMSAFMLWLNSAREQIKSEHPGLKVTEIAIKGGEIWRGMKDKSVWEEKAAEAKEQYIKDLESYNANVGAGEGGNTLKRPMSSYMLWLNSAREQIKSEHPGLKVTEIAIKGGEIWRGMKDKSVWEEKAAKAKEQYAKDLETYIANGGAGEGSGTKKAQKRGKKAGKRGKTKKIKEESDSDIDSDNDSDNDSDDEMSMSMDEMETEMEEDTN